MPMKGSGFPYVSGTRWEQLFRHLLQRLRDDPGMFAEEFRSAIATFMDPAARDDYESDGYTSDYDGVYEDADGTPQVRFQRGFDRFVPVLFLAAASQTAEAADVERTLVAMVMAFVDSHAAGVLADELGMCWLWKTGPLHEVTAKVPGEVARRLAAVADVSARERDARDELLDALEAPEGDWCTKGDVYVRVLVAHGFGAAADIVRVAAARDA